MNARKIHFIGIGGAGMSVLSSIMLDKGVRISGSDIEDNAKCLELRRRGAAVAVGHAAENLPMDAELAVYSSAIKPDNPELAAARSRGIECRRRGEFLSELAMEYRRVVAVTGAHGKSSVSALIVHLLKKCTADPGFMIGAELHQAPSGGAGDGDIFVTEADESDGSNTLFAPRLGVVTELDDDHAWSVGGAERLAENYRRFGGRCEQLIYSGAKSRAVYGTSGNASEADSWPIPERWIGFERRNLELALSAVRALGYAPVPAMADDFGGVARRMTVRFERGNTVCVEDYAHHPQELEAALEYLRLKYPGRFLLAVFQPHRYIRLERYFDRFASVLKTADAVLVLPVFAAWSESGKCSGADLAAACGGIYGSDDWRNNAELALRMLPERPSVLAVIGAGDLDRIFKWL